MLIKMFLQNMLDFIFEKITNLHQLIGAGIGHLSGIVTTLGLIFILSLLYLFIRKNTQRTLSIELRKRKEILMDIDLYKKTHPELLEDEDEKSDETNESDEVEDREDEEKGDAVNNDVGNKSKETIDEENNKEDEVPKEDEEYATLHLRNNKKYPDRYYNVLNYIADERWRAKPHRIFFAIFYQVLFLLTFISFIPYMKNDFTYFNFELLFLSAILINALQILISKRVKIISVVVLFVLALIYYRLPYELLLLLALNNVFTLLNSLIKKPN